jgi:hypothetical protein
VCPQAEHERCPDGIYEAPVYDDFARFEVDKRAGVLHGRWNELQRKFVPVIID